MIKPKFQVGELVRCSSRLPSRIRVEQGYSRRRMMSSTRAKLKVDVGIIVDIEATSTQWSHLEHCYLEKAEYQIKFFQTGLTVFLNDIHIKKAK